MTIPNVENYPLGYVSIMFEEDPRAATLKLDMKTILLFMLLLAVVGWTIVPVASAEANGKSIPIFSSAEGPYQIQFRVSPPTPKVGKLHIVLVIQYLATGEPVDSALVNITALGPSPDRIALDSLQLYDPESESNWYEADLLIPEAGTWQVNAEINHEGQVTSVSIPIVVESWNVDAEILVLIASSIPLLVTTAWYFRRKYSNK